MKSNNYYLAIASIVIIFNAATVSSAKKAKTAITREKTGSSATIHKVESTSSNPSTSDGVHDKFSSQADLKEERPYATSICGTHPELCPLQKGQ
ncbi:MAG: hypothetical protein WCG16_14310 [Methylococcales bacterium]